MRCPKCHYISFDGGDRCRNCGYDFSLTVDVRDLDLPIQTGDEPIGPLSDLDLGKLDGPAGEPLPSSVRPAGSPLQANDDRAAQSAQPRRPATSSPLDLPLFVGRDDAAAPLLTPPAAPRPPLAVRRAAAAAVKPRPPVPEPREEPALDLGAPAPKPAPRPAPALVHGAVAETARFALAPASLGRRGLAGAIDMAILGAIDAAVLYFTLELCGLRWYEALLIPVIPFGAFLLLLNGGYLVAFTAAAGQTIGKMAAGVRVVPWGGGDTDRVPFGFAVLRAAAYLVSVLPLGLGFIPAFLGAEHRALHDRLSDTRVVRA